MSVDYYNCAKCGEIFADVCGFSSCVKCDEWFGTCCGDEQKEKYGLNEYKQLNKCDCCEGVTIKPEDELALLKKALCIYGRQLSNRNFESDQEVIDYFISFATEKEKV